ncbi:hypothetical protein JOM56_004976 [Amanita muscaria]
MVCTTSLGSLSEIPRLKYLCQSLRSPLPAEFETIISSYTCACATSTQLVKLQMPIHQSNVRERAEQTSIAADTVPILRCMDYSDPETTKLWIVMNYEASRKRIRNSRQLVLSIVTYSTAEPFLPNIFTARYLLRFHPLATSFIAYFGWLDEAMDNQVINNVKESVACIRQAVMEDGQNITGAPKYPNYALLLE